MQRLLGEMSTICLSVIALNGCARAQESFETVQMCVGNPAGVIALKRLMISAAQSEGIQFIDDSAHQAKELKDIGAEQANKRNAASAIDFHIEGANGLGVTAGNLGLPRYQIGMGFTEGDDPAKAHRLAKQLVSALPQQWDVQRVADGKGILPMKSCGG